MIPDLIEIKRLECDILLKLYYGSTYNTRKSNYDLFINGIDDMKFKLKYDIEGFKLKYSSIFNFRYESGFYIITVKNFEERYESINKYLDKMQCSLIEKLFILSAYSSNNESSNVLPKELRDKICSYCSTLGYIMN